MVMGSSWLPSYILDCDEPTTMQHGNVTMLHGNGFWRACLPPRPACLTSACLPACRIACLPSGVPACLPTCLRDMATITGHSIGERMADASTINATTYTNKNRRSQLVQVRYLLTCLLFASWNVSGQGLVASIDIVTKQKQ